LCSSVETKQEWDKSNALLTEFLYETPTTRVIGTACRNAVINLQSELSSDEDKYAGYFRRTIKNSMGAMTTSPVEGHNRVLKHGPLKINAQYHLHTVMNRVIQTIRRQLTQQQNHAVRQLSRTNCASNAPTKQYLINEGQALMDRNYDQRIHVKSAQLAPKQWIAWPCFSCDHPDECADNPEYLRIPQFVRVNLLDLRTVDGKKNCIVRVNNGAQRGSPARGVLAS